MALGSSDLVHPVHLNAQRKRSHDMRYPLTPIFNDHSSSGRDFSTVRMSMIGGPFAQNQTTNGLIAPDPLPDPEEGYSREAGPSDALCGNAAYLVSTLDTHHRNSNPAALVDETFTEVRTFSLDFVTTPGSEQVYWKQVVTGVGSGAIQPTPFHSQTASYRIQGDADPVPPDPPDHMEWYWKELTYSDPVERSYLKDKLEEWQAQTQTFRFATDNSIHDTAYATESDDGHAAVNGGHFKIRNSSPFSTTLPTPAASDEDLWAGNYFAHILVSRRMLSPVLYGEKYKTTTGTGGTKSAAASGMGIYNEGYSEEVLSDPITEGIWRDDYGVFDDGAGLLDAAPKECGLFFSLGDLPYYTSAGMGHEVVFISRNGRQTRLTIEEVEYGYDYEEPYGEIITVLSSVQITTDPDTLRVSYTFPPDIFNTVRVGLVEQLVGVEWVAIGGEEVIGGDATDPGVRVLQYVRKRSGERWGFIERMEPYEARYRTLSYTKELSITTELAEDEAGGTACGGVVSGSFIYADTQGYSATTGQLQPKIITDFEMLADGTDWTVEDPEYVNGHVFGTTTTDDATTLRKEMIVYPQTGRFFVRFDDPRDFISSAAFKHGKVISSEWIKVAVTVDGSYHIIDWREIPTASEGECVTVDGFRLSET